MRTVVGPLRTMAPYVDLFSVGAALPLLETKNVVPLIPRFLAAVRVAFLPTFLANLVFGQGRTSLVPSA